MVCVSIKIQKMNKKNSSKEILVREGQIKELKELTEELTNLADRKIGSTLTHLGQYWKGENAVVYLKKGEALQKHIEITAKEINQMVEAIDISNKKEK